MFKKLPNILTIGRIFLTFGFIYFLIQPGSLSKLLAAIIFLVASITDYYDGYLAKKYQLVTNFGKIMDPIADKFLVLSAFFLFAMINVIPYWMFAVIAFREMVVTALRLRAMKRNEIHAAEKSGKVKTVFQIVSISIILIYLILVETNAGTQWPAYVFDVFNNIILAVMTGSVIVTIISGVSYFKNNVKVS